jgi:hypothetical protein
LGAVAAGLAATAASGAFAAGFLPNGKARAGEAAIRETAAAVKVSLRNIGNGAPNGADSRFAQLPGRASRNR